MSKSSKLHLLSVAVPALMAVAAIAGTPPPARASGERCTIDSPAGMSCQVIESGTDGDHTWFIFQSSSFEKISALTITLNSGDDHWTGKAPNPNETEGCEATASNSECDAKCDCLASSCTCSSYVDFAMCLWWEWNGSDWEMNGYGEGC